MKTQTEIADYFKEKYGTKISQDRVSRFVRGIEKVSWPFAADLAQEFPGKTIQQWKNATPKELKKAFVQLPDLPDKEASA